MRLHGVVLDWLSTGTNLPYHILEPSDSPPTFKVKGKVRVTLRLAVYSQSTHLGAKPLSPKTCAFFQLNTWNYIPSVTSSLTRGRVCSLQLLMALAIAVILRSESRWIHDHTLLSQIRDSPNLEDQVPVFISLKNRLARLYPQALGSLFVAPYESQGYRIENTASNSSSIISCVFIAAGKYLSSRCLAMTVSSVSTILVYRRHVTLFFS
jgi:hypothetical protein